MSKLLKGWLIIITMGISTLGCAASAKSSGTIGESESVVVQKYRSLSTSASAGSGNEKFAAWIYAYENAEELEEFREDALRHLTDAADQDLLDARYNLGFLYRDSGWVERSDQNALHWFEKSADGGYPRGQLWASILTLELLLEEGSEEAADNCRVKIEIWLRALIAAHDASDRISLAAKEVLGTAMISISFNSEEGWQLLVDSSAAGYEEATNRLIELKAILDEMVSEGFEANDELVDRIDIFLHNART